MDTLIKRRCRIKSKYGDYVFIKHYERFSIPQQKKALIEFLGDNSLSDELKADLNRQLEEKNECLKLEKEHNKIRKRQVVSPYIEEINKELEAERKLNEVII